MNPAEPPLVSVIIPVFNQAADLRRCLAAFEMQTYPSGRFEVIVVDNGSDPPARDLVSEFSFARCIAETKPGSYAARNRGVGASRGSVLAFTDADCVPAKDWIERGARALCELSGAGMVGGKIELTLRDPDNPTAAELFERVLGFQQKTYIEWGFAATANVFCTRTTLERFGLFDERLLSGGDMEWGQRLRSQGLPQVYAQEVCVSHAARRSLRQLFKKSLRVAGGIQMVADQRGEGISGLPEHAFQQLVKLWRIRGHIGDERLDTLGRKLKFASVVWMVELLQTIERFRVHFGGAPRRT